MTEEKPKEKGIIFTWKEWRVLEEACWRYEVSLDALLEVFRGIARIAFND